MQPEIGLDTRHVTVSIQRTPAEVYAFAAQPENLPSWAGGLCSSITLRDGEWIAEGPLGTVRVQFTEPNHLGVLDHDVILDSGVRSHNPIRVVPNGSGCEVMLTLFRQPTVPQQDFERDAAAVLRDLQALKALLEDSSAPTTDSQAHWPQSGDVHSHHAIDYVELTVPDVAAAKRFYGTAFGWSFNDYGPDYAGIETQGREVGGLRVDNVGGAALVILYSRSLDDTLTRVRDAGGRIVTGPYSFPGGRRFHFRDPAGNELAVWSET